MVITTASVQRAMTAPSGVATTLGTVAATQLQVPANIAAAAKKAGIHIPHVVDQPIFAGSFQVAAKDLAVALATDEDRTAFGVAVLSASAPTKTIHLQAPAQTLTVKPLDRNLVASAFVKTVKAYQSGTAELPRTSADNYPYKPPKGQKANLETLTKSLLADPNSQLFSVYWDDTDSCASNGILAVNPKTGAVSLIGIWSQN